MGPGLNLELARCFQLEILMISDNLDLVLLSCFSNFIFIGDFNINFSDSSHPY